MLIEFADSNALERPAELDFSREHLKKIIDVMHASGSASGDWDPLGEIKSADMSYAVPY
jgi:hypothetical protein